MYHEQLVSLDADVPIDYRSDDIQERIGATEITTVVFDTRLIKYPQLDAEVAAERDERGASHGRCDIRLAVEGVLHVDLGPDDRLPGSL